MTLNTASRKLGISRKVSDIWVPKGLAPSGIDPVSYRYRVLGLSPLLHWACIENSNFMPDYGLNGYIGSCVNISPSLDGSPWDSSDRTWHQSGSGWIQANCPAVNTSPCTMMTWVYVDSIPGSTRSMLLFANNDGSGTREKWFKMDSSGFLNWHTYDGGTRILVSNTALTTGRWYHIAGSIGAAGSKILINGVQDAINVGTTSSYTGYGPNNILLGGTADGLSRLLAKYNDFSVFASQLPDATIAWAVGL